MDDLTTTQGIVALAGLGVGAIALLVGVQLAVRLRRVRASQRVVLGDNEQDLVAHAERIESGFRALSEFIEEAATRLDARMTEAERRLDGAIAHSALVRYDAYNEMSGRQSTSIALLDASQSGVVITSIHHREQARVYAKVVREGQSDLELSPEETEAVRLALAGGGVATLQT